MSNEYIEVEMIGLDGLPHKIKTQKMECDLTPTQKRKKLFKENNSCKDCSINLPPRGPSVCSHCSEVRRIKKIKAEFEERRAKRRL